MTHHIREEKREGETHQKAENINGERIKKKLSKSKQSGIRVEIK